MAMLKPDGKCTLDLDKQSSTIQSMDWFKGTCSVDILVLTFQNGAFRFIPIWIFHSSSWSVGFPETWSFRLSEI